MKKLETKASQTLTEEPNGKKRLFLQSKNYKLNPKNDIMRQMMLKHSSKCDEN
jgi:hypothetical protein